MKDRIVIVDGFYAKPDGIRATALVSPFFQPSDLIGLRTKPCLPPRLRRRFEQKFGITIHDWQSDDWCANGAFFVSPSHGKHAETRHVHADDPLNWCGAVVYLYPDARRNSGTSFWCHKKTGLMSWPTRTDAKRLDIPFAALERLLIEDGHRKSPWEEVDRIANVYNRAVLFPNRRFHSATSHFGSTVRSSRLIQGFSFGIDAST